jgi:ArsR family transcriptional regulator, virulence genes transcriptional regulator
MGTKKSLMTKERAEALSDVLRNLANPTRLRLVALLVDRGEQTVGDLARALGLTQAATSQGLAALRLGGLVRVRREGGFRYYDLAIPDLAALVRCLTSCGGDQGRLAAGAE